MDARLFKSTNPGTFSLQFVIHYSGSSDVNNMSLAHNKITIEDARGTGVDPVIGQESAWMWLKVSSPFNPELALEGIPVNGQSTAPPKSTRRAPTAGVVFPLSQPSQMSMW